MYHRRNLCNDKVKFYQFEKERCWRRIKVGENVEKMRVVGKRIWATSPGLSACRDVPTSGLHLPLRSLILRFAFYKIFNQLFKIPSEALIM